MFEMVDPYDDPDDPGGGEPTGPPSAQEMAEAGAALEAVEARHAADVLAGMDADETLAVAGSGQRELNLTGARQLAVAAHWADLHGVLDCLATIPAASTGAGAAAGRRRGRELLAQPGGEGTPGVAEFAPAELGVVLGVSVAAAGSLIADALDLRHRLPLLWGRVQGGEVKTWVARGVARRTRRLSQAAAAAVDRKVTPLVASVAYGRVEKILDAAVLTADPDQAAADAKAAADGRGVWVGRETVSGHGTVFGKAAAIDVAALDAALDTVAGALGVLGDADGTDARRAKALGVLADPQAALDLVGHAEQTRQAAAAAGQADRAADGGSAPVCDRRPFTLGPVTLYLHLSAESLTDRAGVARIEDIGPVLLGQVQDWLQHRDVTMRPVLDIAGLPAVDCYEIPDRMADAVRLRTPADCFPYSTNISRRGDLDHTVPYVPMPDGGPPGQTSVDNLARMTRRTHRIKTHSRWTVTQPRSGVWIWRTPHGHHYLVDSTGTRPQDPTRHLGKGRTSGLDKAVFDSRVVKDLVQLTRAVQVPSERGIIVPHVPSGQAGSDEGELHLESADCHRQTERLLITGAASPCLHDTSQDQTKEAGVEIVGGDRLQVAQSHRIVEPVSPRRGPCVGQPVDVNHGVGHSGFPQQGADDLGDGCLADSDRSSDQQRTGAGHARQPIRAHVSGSAPASR